MCGAANPHLVTVLRRFVTVLLNRLVTVQLNRFITDCHRSTQSSSIDLSAYSGASRSPHHYDRIPASDCHIDRLLSGLNIVAYAQSGCAYCRILKPRCEYRAVSE
jgi:hypothetical protein